MGTPAIPGRFRLSNRASEVDALDPWVGAQRRVRAILTSIQRDLFDGGTARVRQILVSPRELYRVEVEREDMSYTRTTILDRDALEALLEETPEAMVEERFSFV
ncbi:MAG: hypothetical protein JRG82_14445 [Deltaproteobacteria bacterium]|nr:hypothetical protein [Deltaproteobacteria bacterium]